MTEQIQNALIAEASRQGTKLLDADVLRIFPDITDHLDPSDSKAITEAVQKMAELKPTLFKPQKKWNEMEPGSDEWRKREEQFRASNRTKYSVDPIPWKLDSAILEDYELGALTRVLQGRGSSYDRSILDHAQRRLSSTGDNAGK